MVSVDDAPIDSEGSFEIRSRGRLGSAGLENPFFYEILGFFGGVCVCEIATVEGFEPGTP